MSDAERENLSALSDGELSRDEVRFLLRRVEGDAQLCATWDRYHVIGDGLRRQTPVMADADFADRVMQRIESSMTATEQPAQTSQRHGRVHHWLRWSAGGAIAAGVAAAALIVVQPQMRSRTAGNAVASGTRVAALGQTASSAQPTTAPDVPRWLSVSPSAAQLAQPAAASFYLSRPERRVRSHGYQRRINPYMALPGYRAPHVREARQLMQRMWSMTPGNHTPSTRRVLRIRPQ